MKTQWLNWTDFLAQVKSKNRGRLVDLSDNPLPTATCGKWVVFSNPEFTKLVVEFIDDEIAAKAWHEKFKHLGHDHNISFEEKKSVRVYMHKPVCTNYNNRILTFWFVSSPAYPKGCEPPPKRTQYD